MFDSHSSNSHELSNRISSYNSIGTSLSPLAYGLENHSSALNLDKPHATALTSDHSLEGLVERDRFKSHSTQSDRDRVTRQRPRKQSLTTKISDLDELTGIGKGESLVTGKKDVTTQAVYTRRGQLDAGDALNPTRIGRYKDDYRLNVQSDRVRLNLNSSDFDAYLQVINPRTGRVLAENDDSGPGANAQLTFNPQAGVNYIVRVTSYGSYERGSYTLIADTDPDSPPSNPGRFNSSYGYGTVNAASAVGRAIGQAKLADVPDLGGYNWGNDLVKAPEAWARGFTGQNTTVAVVDTGVDYTHIDLDANIWTNSREISGNGIDDDGNGYVDDTHGWNFISDNNNTMDDQGHGTHVSGTIAAENNGLGVTGVAYNAKIMPVKVLDSEGSGSSESVAAGIRYAAANGADVINLSLGSAFPSSVIERAVRYATEQGSLVVMAAGNSGGSAPGYPARYATQYGISVGAIDRNQSLASFSNRAGSDSRLQHVVAPGVDIYSTLPGNRYASYNGTSMATPHVAGVAALMLSANSNLTPTQMQEILTGTAVNRSATSPSATGRFDNAAPLGQVPGISMVSTLATNLEVDGLDQWKETATIAEVDQASSELFSLKMSDGVNTNVSFNGAIEPDELTVQEATSSGFVTVFNSIDAVWSDRTVQLPESDFDALLAGELDEYAVARK